MLEWIFTRVVQPGLPAALGYAASILIRNELYIWLLVPLGVLILLSWVATLPWWMRPGTLSILLRLARDSVGVAADEDVRCAIFRPTLFKKSLVEVAIATESGEQQRKDRVKMKVSQGVAGRAYRTAKLCCVPITEDWDDQLMTELGFTARELARFRSDRKSYLCIPILGEHEKVLAVLSLDSKQPDTFNTDRIERIEYIATYISAAIGGE